MNKTIPSILLGAGLLAGCTLPAGLGTASDEVNVTVRAAIQAPAAGYRTQGALPTYYYSLASINHLVLRVVSVDEQGSEHEVLAGNAPLVVDMPRAYLDQPVRLSKLHARTKYRIKASAYKAAGTDAADLISTEDGNCYVEFTVGTTPVVGDQVVPVKLKNVDFSGVATGSVSVTDGSVNLSDEAIDSYAVITATLTNSGEALYLNGDAWGGYQTTLTPNVSATKAKLKVTNNSSIPVQVYDLNATGHTDVAAGATASIEVKVQNGAINTRFTVPA